LNGFKDDLPDNFCDLASGHGLSKSMILQVSLS